MRDKHRKSTGEVQDKLATVNVNLIKLIGITGEGQMSVKDIMQAVHLKGRDNFLNTYCGLLPVQDMYVYYIPAGRNTCNRNTCAPKRVWHFIAS